MDHPEEQTEAAVTMTARGISLGTRVELVGAGDRLHVVLELEDGRPVAAPAEFVRIQARGTRWIISIRFVDLAERDGDRVRRRVFRALREERSRLSG